MANIHAAEADLPHLPAAGFEATEDDAGLMRQLARLRASEARFRAVADLVPDLLWRNDSRGSGTWYNRRWCEYTGLSVEQSVDYGWVDTIHPEDAGPSQARFYGAMAARSPLRHEVRLRRADGAYRWHLVQNVPVVDEQGSVTEWFGSATDIHDQHLALEALRESQDRYRTLAELSPDPIFVNQDGVYVYANAAAGRVLEGKGPEAIVGRTPADVLDPEHQALAAQRLAAAVSGGGMLPLAEFRWRRGDGTYVDVEGAAGPISWNGRPAVQIVARDITRRKQMETELRASREHYWQLFDSIDEGFVVAEVLFGEDGRVRDVYYHEANPASERITGLAFLGKYLTELYPGLEPFWFDAWERVARTRVGERTEGYTASRAAWYTQYLFPLGEAAEHRVGCIFQDITRQRQDAAALEQARAAAELASMAKSQFLSTISHELRTPLTAVLGYTDLLQGEVPGPVNSRQHEYLERIKASTRHLVHIIDEILTYTRSEAGRDELRPEPVDLAAVAREVVALLAGQARAQGLRLALHGIEQPLIAVTDEGKVRQILLNLAGNALKYTEAGSIDVELQCSPGCVLVHVRDTGLGIPADRLEDIFEPFVQVDGSMTRSRGGTGLGLAISRRQARLLGGDVTVLSSPGAGSTFTFRLPTS